MYKEAPNRNTCYKSLEEGLRKVLRNLQWQQGGKSSMSLGLPLIGCGLAGGDWEGVVFPMIKGLFENSGVDVTVFVF